MCFETSEDQQKGDMMNNSRIIRGTTQVMALTLVLASACKGPEARADTTSENAQRAGSAPVAQAQPVSGPVNAKCPVMGGKVDVDGELATFNGKSIGFCCPGCKPKWEAWSAAEKADFIAKAEAR